jgi:hypothetical protein
MFVPKSRCCDHFSPEITVPKNFQITWIPLLGIPGLQAIVLGLSHYHLKIVNCNFRFFIWLDNVSNTQTFRIILNFLFANFDLYYLKMSITKQFIIFSPEYYISLKTLKIQNKILILQKTALKIQVILCQFSFFLVFHALHC